jgi:signal transduction histidine kinase
MTIKAQEPLVSLQTILEEAVQTISGLFDAHNVYIALYDEATSVIRFPVVYDRGKRVTDGEKVKGARWAPRSFGARKDLTEWVIRHKSPLLLTKNTDSWFTNQKDIDSVPIDMKCWLGVPMTLRDGTVGVIAVQNVEREAAFGDYHQNLLVTLASTIASQASIAAENANLVRLALQAERLQTLQQIADERKRRLDLLQKISQRMAEANLNSDNVLQMVAYAANEISNSDLAILYHYDQETSSLIRGISVDRETGIEHLSPDDLPGPGDLPTQIARTQETVFIDEISGYTGTYTFATHRSLQAFAALPLSVRGAYGMTISVGVLLVGFEEIHSFSQEEQEILRHLASQAALAIAYVDAHQSAMAREQLAALGTAAATIQHRLGNTINVILPAVMRLRYRVGHDAGNLEILNTIERNALFATEVIRRMQTPLRQEPFVRTNFNSLLRDAIQKCVQDVDRFPNARLATNLPGLGRAELAPGVTPAPQIAITAELDEALPDTYASSTQLTEVFRVLVENAIKAIYPAGGSVQVTSRLCGDRPPHYVEVTVSDTGKGVDEKTRSKLFKQPVPRREFGEGAGLGLWLSQIIVRSHRGSIGLEFSEPGRGSVFLVRLPILDQSLETAGRPGEAA